MDWQPDWELRARMVAVLALLLLFLVALPLALFWGIRITLSLPWILARIADGGLLFPYSGHLISREIAAAGVLAVLLVVLLFEAIARRSSAIADFRDFRDDSTGVDDTVDTPSEVAGTVTRLAQLVDLPVPNVRVRRSALPNAYTKGLTRRRATIVVTTGLLDALGPSELEAVLAHELAHVKNRDAEVMTAGSFVFVVAQRLVDATDRFAAASDDIDDTIGTLGGLYLLAVTPVARVFWFVSRAFVRILSQYREYAADRGAVAITGNPGALAGALTTLDRRVAALPGDDLRERRFARMAFYVVPVSEEPVRPAEDADDDFDVDAYTGFGVAGSERTALDEVLASVSETGSAVRDDVSGATDLPTHPPTARRIARLRELQKHL